MAAHESKKFTAIFEQSERRKKKTHITILIGFCAHLSKCENLCAKGEDRLDEKQNEQKNNFKPLTSGYSLFIVTIPIEKYKQQYIIFLCVDDTGYRFVSWRINSKIYG